MPNRFRSGAFAALVSTLAACSADPVSPSGVAVPVSPVPAAPSALLGSNESVRVVTDSVDAFGNTILVQEFAAGVYYEPNGDGASVASVTIRTVLPGSASASSSGVCLTHSIVKTEALPGNKLTVKKSGGCNKDVVVLVEQTATRLKATFSFSMVPGKTVIDSGLLR